jgi:ADP-dependent NAD(P)H-hydrate dehydratase
VSEARVITPALLREWALPDPGTSKETRGRTLVVGGHVETPGAVLLAAEAALRCGAGKLQVATVADVAPHLAVAMPEALVRGLPQTPDGDIAPQAADRILDLADGCAAVLLGPGMGDVEVVGELLARIVPQLDGTVVLDAAALAHASSSPDALARLGGRCALTPNPHELALALDVEQEAVDADAAGHALRLARATGAVVSCGGPETTIAHPDGRLWLDASGGVGLAVSGSGDVHAGIVVGLAARGATPEQAAAWAAHLHGRAGDRLAADVGPLGFLAREVAAEVPRVLAEIDV